MEINFYWIPSLSKQIEWVACCRICTVMCDLSVTHAQQSTLGSVVVVFAWMPSVSLHL